MGAPTLVDSNVLIDVISGDLTWEAWSAKQLARAAASGSIAINPVIYAEVSIGFARIESCESALGALAIERREVPWPAAFLAGKAYLDYRRRGGARSSPLPDFFIGAHAAVEGMQLLTRDPTRYQTYFPRVELIAPD
ncbi:MAG: type II toxin-antitoxin system VapC family toxin [Solirubrobacterales bacterium]